LNNIDKNLHPNKIDNKNITKIISSIKNIIKDKINSQIIYKNKEAVDAVPIDLEFYKDFEKKKFSNYNEALDMYFTRELKTVNKKESAYTKKLNELKRIMEEQKVTLKELKEKENENRKKGESIYNNYQLIKEILDNIHGKRLKRS